MAKILVTGAAGFIGSHTTDCLLGEGHAVVGVDNFRTGRKENLATALRSPAFALHVKDVAAPGVLAALVAAERPDAIIHLAALVSVQESIANPELNFSLNVQASQLVAEAARLHGVGRVVFASSAAIYGDAAERPIRESAEKRPVSPYGAAKLASEDLLLGHGACYGFTVRCQRYFNVFGTRQDPASPYSGVISIFARNYREGKPATWPARMRWRRPGPGSPRAPRTSAPAGRPRCWTSPGSSPPRIPAWALPCTARRGPGTSCTRWAIPRRRPRWALRRAPASPRVWPNSFPNLRSPCSHETTHPPH